MRHDEIIAMAKEAGCIPRRSPEYWEDVQVFATPDVLVKFVQLVAAHERELCALIADSERHCTEMLTSYPPQSAAARNIAVAIRARGQHT